MKKAFLAIAFIFAVSTCLKGQVVKFQENPPSGKKWNIAIAKKFADKGAVTVLDAEDGKKGVLRITSKGSKERYIGVNFQIFGDVLKSLKNKSLRFKMLVKHVSGNSKLTTRMRSFKSGKKHWEFILGSPPHSFKGVKGKWIPLELICRIPDLPGIDIVDFQTGARPIISDVVEYLVDKVELEVLNDKALTDVASPLISYVSRNDSGKMEVIKNRKALAAIVTEKNPTRTVKYAVKELNRHIELCMGVELPVITEEDVFIGPKIFIGKTALAERFGVSPDYLAPDHWIVRSLGGNLIISGGDNKANLNPVSSPRAPSERSTEHMNFLKDSWGSGGIGLENWEQWRPKREI